MTSSQSMSHNLGFYIHDMKSRVLRHLGKEHDEIIAWQSQTYIIDTDQIKEKINEEKNMFIQRADAIDQLNIRKLAAEREAERKIKENLILNEIELAQEK